MIFVYMECLGAPNFAAMAVSTSAPWRSRRRRMRPENACFNHRDSCYLPSVRVRASAGSESCVVVKEGFADEEDYIKAGGSELLFVQMQQNKAMNEQSKLADKVSLLCGGKQPNRVVVLYSSFVSVETRSFWHFLPPYIQIVLACFGPRVCFSLFESPKTGREGETIE